MLPRRLECRNVWFRFDERYVLSGADLEAMAGRPVALFGPNGSGKTTLLRILAGLLTPVRGSVSWQDESGAACPPEGVRAGRLYVGSEPGLAWDLSATRNLELFAGLYGLEPARAAESLEAVGLDPSDGRPLRALSHGQRRRADLARLLLFEPAIILLDEPELGLDAWSRKVLLGRLEALAAQALLVLATHDRSLVEALGCQVVEVRAGRTRPAGGQPEEEAP